jgi:hypothetical protein
MEEFFSHENHPWPPSLSEHGKLYLPSKKSDLLCIFDTSGQPEPPSHYNSKIFDGAAIVHSLPTSQACTFDEYGDNIFLPWMKQQLQNSERIDIVWDIYKQDSLKGSTRAKRGKGLRRKVGGNTKLPTNFPDFLRDPINKEELFDLLTRKVSTCRYPAAKEVYITSGWFG